jgi:hypothetical protein
MQHQPLIEGDWRNNNMLSGDSTGGSSAYVSLITVILQYIES